MTELDVYDHIAELTRPHRNSAAYTITRGATTITQNHVVKVPSLLRQLEWVAPTGRGDDRTGGGYESRPAAALEALNILATIDTQAGIWLRRLGADKTWGETEDLLARLAGQVRGLEQNQRCHRKHGIRDKTTNSWCCRFHEIGRDITSWWTQARVATGWDSPAWRPDNTCPICGEHGSLRVKEADKIGFCVECHETWIPETIGMLAEHIRLENAAGRRTTADAAVCWCPVPQPEFARWPAMCPGCGSRYCHRAVEAVAS